MCTLIGPYGCCHQSDVNSLPNEDESMAKQFKNKAKKKKKVCKKGGTLL